MADKTPDDKSPILVDVKPFAVKTIDEPKYKDRAIKRLTEATVASLNGRLAKGSKGYTLDGSLLKFGPDKAGKMLAAECQIAISTDKGGVKSMANGKAAFAIPGRQQARGRRHRRPLQGSRQVGDEVGHQVHDRQPGLSATSPARAGIQPEISR